MIGLIILGLAVVAVFVLVVYTYVRPGPDEKKLEPPEESPQW